MVPRFLKNLYAETSGLHEAAFLLATFALLSKFLALIRDRLLAHNFGASIDLDVYYAAFRIPDFIYISLGTLVASAVLIPFFIARLSEKERAQNFLNNIFTIFFVSIFLVSALFFILMPFLVSLVAPGFSAEAESKLITLSRIMLFSPILLGLSGLFASVTQSLRKFFIYALSPVLYNVGIIGGVVFLYPAFGLSGLAYGVVAGAILHFVIQIPVLVRERFVPRFTRHVDLRELWEVLTLSLPRTLTLSAHHLVILIFIALASFLEEGSITVFNFAFNLQSVPLSIIGISYSVAAFPTLARFFSNGEIYAFNAQVISALRHIIFWSFPALVLFIVLRAQVVRVILGTGEFGWTETRLTAAALALFATSLIAQSVILLLVRGYYAAGKTLTPLVVNVASSFLIVIFGISFTKLFQNADFFRYFMESLLRIDEVAGSAIIMLPLAFSAGSLINAYILWSLFRKTFSVSTTALRRTLWQSFLAAVTMGFVAHQFLRIFDNVFDINTFVGIFLQGLLSGTLGIFAAIIVLRLIKNEEIVEITRSLKHKFWKEKPIVPDQAEL